MKQIDHDPKEAPRKKSRITYEVVAMAIGMTFVLVIMKADWEALQSADESLLGVVALSAVVFGSIAAVTWALLKAWDWLAAVIRRS